MLSPDYTEAAHAAEALRRHGQAVLSGDGLARLAGVGRAALEALVPSWERLPPDAHLRDGGHYRRRRHSCYRIETDRVEPVPHRAHWQPVEYNALHGGIERWFEPVEPAIAASAAWAALLTAFARLASGLRGARPWYAEAHQFRIDTEGGIGRPTPEGAHRDGVDLVVVALVARRGVKGGETRVFDADGPQGQRFTLTEPWTTLLLDDARKIHETTPIQPLDAAQGGGVRDTLVVTMRAGGFPGPAD
jgi:hypothetical protein